MSLQNRVTPFGRLEAVAARGAWMGNRGILHNERREIVAQWRSKAWITCRLDWPGVHRAVFSPHTWSELFFLDEATAFAAGHRPCAYCRRERYNAFKQAWCAANARPLPAPQVRATVIDARLHVERVTPEGRKVTWRVRFGALPDGAFIVRDGAAWLVWKGRLWPWAHAGYGRARPPLAAGTTVDVLTPASIVGMFGTGFTPQVHASAGGAPA
ncbi:MAG TPA: hypothetical protein VFQ95_06905 [Rhodanobacteraceae bacterium]|nr:hypothetical protein [Rhodanobacteraceae bacterium]